MNTPLKFALAAAGFALATQAVAQVTFYEDEGFRGRTFTATRQIGDFERYGFNDRASSAVVKRDRWEVCEDARFRGHCVVLRPGRYPSLAAMGLDDGISSVRMVARNARVEDERYAPGPVAGPDYRDRDSQPVYQQPAYQQPTYQQPTYQQPTYQQPTYQGDPNAYRRRDNERIYEVEVTSVRAVVGPPEQRCWIEREQVPQERGSANVPGAIAGAVIGGILGHQVGSGRGQDLATAGGAVAGAAVGANVGRDGRPAQTRDVERCSTTPSNARTEYWDVTYDFRGEQHRVQMTAPPGRTIAVNEQGEPRS